MRPFLSLCLVAPALLGQTISLSDPAKPATLKATLMNGSLRVEGHAGKNVIVEGLEAGPDPYPGMRRIGGTLEARDNVVHLRAHNAPAHRGGVVVKLPHGSTVDVRCMAGGPLVIEDVRGPVEAEHMAGDIRIRGAQGAVAATTYSGSITVDLPRMEGPVNLATLSGHITLTLPGDTKADLKAHVMSRSRFHCELPFQEDSEPRDRNPGPQVLRGTLNGGGAKVTLRGLSGTLTIRKR